MMLTNEVIAECGSTKRSNAERMNELAKAVRSGDMDKFDALYELAKKLATKVVNSDDTLPQRVQDEIVQDTMTKLYLHIDKVEYVSTWVRKVVKRAIIDYKRLKTTTSVVSTTVVLDDDSDPDELGKEIYEQYADDSFLSPSEALMRNFTKEAVQSVLQTLPEQQQKVLLLSSSGMFTQEEIAAQMGLSRSTVAADLRAGKKNFQKKFSAMYNVADFGYKTTYELTAA